MPPDSPFGIPWNSPTEPTANERSEIVEGASAIRHLYLALVNEGFTEAQALQIVCAMASKS